MILFYIGNTQQKLKLRMGQHFNETRNLVTRNMHSDSFAKHFASHFKAGQKITTKDVRSKVSMEILWKGNPISCCKSFGKINCSLCMKERLEIFKALKEKGNSKKVINSNNELYGACRHKPRFHRYLNYNSSTDDGRTSPERVNESAVTNPPPTASTDPNFKLCTYISTSTDNTQNLNSPVLLQEEVGINGKFVMDV